MQHPAFPVEPWAVRETHLDLERLAQTESVFALANGHIGMRGNLDEGEPFGLPGTYLNGLYEVRPLPYAEAAYGDPESSQTVVNVTNGKIIRLLVEDEPFDVRYGELRSHERVLDLQAGTLTRRCEWVSPTGRAVRVTSTRLVSFAQRSAAAILYEVEPLDGEATIVVQSVLVANESLPEAGMDPRVSAVLAAPLESRLYGAEKQRAFLVHTTKASRLTLAAAMDHQIESHDSADVSVDAYPDHARLTIATTVSSGKPLRVTKFLAYGWSAQRSIEAVRDQVGAGLAAAMRTGWDGLVKDQREYLDDYWNRADIEIEGDAELQQAVRFGLFHTLQAGARGERRAIPAKGLTGSGYDGHTFWDTEAFVIAVLTYMAPAAAADALRWRHETLELARNRAQALGLKGAAFPWRTIHGEECSGYWPAGTAAFHINADIASAVVRYTAATGDTDFDRDVGVELLVETARLWRSLGHHDADGNFRLDGVTGPDEYSAIADNNVYTNLMAQLNLRAAAEAAERQPKRAVDLSVDAEEMASWRDAADRMVVPYDDALGVHAQAEGFTQHQRWNFDAMTPGDYPLLLHFPYFDLYRKQVVKQADLVFAMFTRSDYFTDEQKLRNFDYYEQLTVRDSSLSASVQAIVAAEVGHLDLAYDYFAEAALIDLEDLEHNTRDGLHIASLAGAAAVAIAGFGGARDNHGRDYHFRPRLPGPITRIAFRLLFRDRQLSVEVTHEHATYTLLRGDPLPIRHYDEDYRVEHGKPVRRPIPKLPELEPARQPRGRAPLHRRVQPGH